MLFRSLPVQVLFNPRYEQAEMIDSILFGLDALDGDIEAGLIVLGDQPQLRSDVIERILQISEDDAIELLVPSYQMRRGHPWLVARQLWPWLKVVNTPREFLHNYADRIYYLEVETESVLQDLDTPEEYQRYCPGTYQKEEK